MRGVPETPAWHARSASGRRLFGDSLKMPYPLAACPSDVGLPDTGPACDGAISALVMRPRPARRPDHAAMIDEIGFPIRPGGGRIAGAPEHDMKGATAWYPRCKVFSSICPAVAKSQTTANRAFARVVPARRKRPSAGFSTRFAAGDAHSQLRQTTACAFDFHAAPPCGACQDVFQRPAKASLVAPGSAALP